MRTARSSRSATPRASSTGSLGAVAVAVAAAAAAAAEVHYDYRFTMITYRKYFFILHKSTGK